jgi:hypothetical protein
LGATTRYRLQYTEKTVGEEARVKDEVEPQRKAQRNGKIGKKERIELAPTKSVEFEETELEEEELKLTRTRTPEHQNTRTPEHQNTRTPEHQTPAWSEQRKRLGNSNNRPVVTPPSSFCRFPLSCPPVTQGVVKGGGKDRPTQEHKI